MPLLRYAARLAFLGVIAASFVVVSPALAGEAEDMVKRGNALLAINNLPAALEAYTKAIKLNPGIAEAYTNRGLIYMMWAGKKAEACDDWKKACKLGDCFNYNAAKKKKDCK